MGQHLANFGGVQSPFLAVHPSDSKITAVFSSVIISEETETQTAREENTKRNK